MLLFQLAYQTLSNFLSIGHLNVNIIFSHFSDTEQNVLERDRIQGAILPHCDKYSYFKTLLLHIIHVSDSEMLAHCLRVVSLDAVTSFCLRAVCRHWTSWRPTLVDVFSSWRQSSVNSRREDLFHTVSQPPCCC